MVTDQQYKHARLELEKPGTGTWDDVHRGTIRDWEAANPSIWRAIKDGIKAAPQATVESTVLEWVGGQIGDDATLMLSPKEAKEKYNIEVTDPISSTKAYYYGELKKQKEEDLANLSRHFSWKTPVNAALAFATMGAIASFTPVAIASGAAVGATVGTVVPGAGTVIGGVAGALAGVGKNVHSAFRLAKVAEKIGKSAKAAKLANIAKHTVKPIVNSAPAVANGLRKAIDNKVVKSAVLAKAAQAGAGNVLEELVIQSVEKSKGYKYELGPELLALGFFAPAVMTGAMQGVVRARRTLTNNTKVANPTVEAPSSRSLVKKNESESIFGKVDDTPALLKERQFRSALRGNKGAIATFKFKRDGYAHFLDKEGKLVTKSKIGGTKAEAIADAADFMDAHNARVAQGVGEIEVKLSDKPDMNLPKNQVEEALESMTSTRELGEFVRTAEVFMDAGEELGAINRAKDVLGDAKVENYLIETTKGLLKSGMKVKLSELFPQLKTAKDFDDMVRSARTGLKPGQELKIEDVLGLDEDVFNAYAANNRINKEPPIKRNQFEDEVTYKEPQRAIEDQIKAARSETDPAVREMGESADEASKGFEDYIKCMAGELADES